MRFRPRYRGFGTTPGSIVNESILASGGVEQIGGGTPFVKIPPPENVLVEGVRVSQGYTTPAYTSPPTWTEEASAKMDGLPFWAKALIGGAITAVGGIAVHVAYKKIFKGKV